MAMMPTAEIEKHPITIALDYKDNKTPFIFHKKDPKGFEYSEFQPMAFPTQ